jgi:hypothetical protein
MCSVSVCVCVCVSSVRFSLPSSFPLSLFPPSPLRPSVRPSVRLSLLSCKAFLDMATTDHVAVNGSVSHITYGARWVSVERR